MNCDSDDAKICDSGHEYPYVIRICIYTGETCEPAMRSWECYYSGGFMAARKKQETLKFLKNLSRMQKMRRMLKSWHSTYWGEVHRPHCDRSCRSFGPLTITSSTSFSPYFPTGPKCVTQCLMFCIVSWYPMCILESEAPYGSSGSSW